MKNVSTTDDKVLAAAAKCADAKRVLETLFPEVFAAAAAAEAERIRKEKENSKYFDLASMPDSYKHGNTEFHRDMMNTFTNSSAFQIRRSGNFMNKGFCLGYANKFYDNTTQWELIKDNEGILVLVPTKKK